MTTINNPINLNQSENQISNSQSYVEPFQFSQITEFVLPFLNQVDIMNLKLTSKSNYETIKKAIQNKYEVKKHIENIIFSEIFSILEESIDNKLSGQISEVILRSIKLFLKFPEDKYLIALSDNEKDLQLQQNIKTIDQECDLLDQILQDKVIKYIIEVKKILMKIESIFRKKVENLLDVTIYHDYVDIPIKLIDVFTETIKLNEIKIITDKITPMMKSHLNFYQVHFPSINLASLEVNIETITLIFLKKYADISLKNLEFNINIDQKIRIVTDLILKVELRRTSPLFTRISKILRKSFPPDMNLKDIETTVNLKISHQFSEKAQEHLEREEIGLALKAYSFIPCDEIKLNSMADHLFQYFVIKNFQLDDLEAFKKITEQMIEETPVKEDRVWDKTLFKGLVLYCLKKDQYPPCKTRRILKEIIPEQFSPLNTIISSHLKENHIGQAIKAALAAPDAIRDNTLYKLAKKCTDEVEILWIIEEIQSQKKRIKAKMKLLKDTSKLI